MESSYVSLPNLRPELATITDHITQSFKVDALRFDSYDDAFQRELIQFDANPQPLPGKEAGVAGRAAKLAAKRDAQPMQPVRRVRPKSAAQRRASHPHTLQQAREGTPLRRKGGLAMRKRTRETDSDDDSDEEEIQPTRKRPRRSTGRRVLMQDELIEGEGDDSDYIPIGSTRR